MEYNTKRELLLAREYGRNIQKMIHYIRSIENPEIRQNVAEAVIESMKTLNPRLKDSANFQERLWDHFFMIANYDIEVSSPYPKPTKPEKNNESLTRLHYPKRSIKYRHLGGNIEILINKAINETNPNNKEALIHIIIQAMRQLYINRHKETPSDEGLKKELQNLSRGELSYTKNPIYSVLTKLPKGQRNEKQPTIKERSKKNVGRNKFNNHNRKKRS